MRNLVCSVLALLTSLVCFAAPVHASELRDYVAADDDAFRWEELLREQDGNGVLVTLKLTSQRWRDTLWEHQLRVYIPATRRTAEKGFLWVTSRASKEDALLKLIAAKAGIVTATLGNVPNQPLFEGLTEDRLIAYTFDRFRRSGDASWPVLFPMVKSVAKAMDAIGELTQRELGETTAKFIVSGASKRGWTTWLSAAADPRVIGIAPAVFDILNMKVQTEAAQRAYGKQSEKIRPYTELGLVAEIETPPLQRLRGWVDPYSYREQYTMPKLILLGTNDPYWTVDALQHYYYDLPQPKLVYQAPNFGHRLSGSSTTWQTLAAWTQMLVDGEPLPRFEWSFKEEGSGRAIKVQLRASAPLQEARLWTARSDTRDFRDASWSSSPLEAGTGTPDAAGTVTIAKDGFHAVLGEVVVRTKRGDLLTLSTQARVYEPG